MISQSLSYGYLSIENDLNPQLEREIPIQHEYEIKRVKVKKDHPLNKLYCEKVLPEYTETVEHGVLAELEKIFENLKKKERFEINGIPYSPDAIVHRNNATILIEVKTTRSRPGSGKFDQVVHKGAIQAIRNSVAYSIYSGEEVIPKLAVGIFTKTGEKHALLEKLRIYRVGWRNEFKITKEIANELYQLFLEVERNEILAC